MDDDGGLRLGKSGNRPPLSSPVPTLFEVGITEKKGKWAFYGSVLRIYVVIY